MRIWKGVRIKKGRVGKRCKGMEKVTGYGKGVRVQKRCQGMEKVSGYGKGVRVWKKHQGMESQVKKVLGYGKRHKGI